MLERYLAWLITSPLGHGAREDAVKAPTAFFQAIRQHGWDDTLAATALFFPGALPARPPRLTRRLAEYVMAQVEEAGALVLDHRVHGGRVPRPSGAPASAPTVVCQPDRAGRTTSGSSYETEPDSSASGHRWPIGARSLVLMVGHVVGAASHH